MRFIYANRHDGNGSRASAGARLHGIVMLFVLVGCAPSLPMDDPAEASGDQALACDLGLPSALLAACTAGGNVAPIVAAPLASTTPPSIGLGGGVHLVAGSAGNEGVVAFTAGATATYDIYLGTPNIPFRVVAPDGTEVTTTCSASLTATDCAYLRKVSAYTLAAGTKYRLEFGPITTVRYVRVVIQQRVPVLTCSAAQLPDEANACTATTDDDVPISGVGSTAVSVDTVYGLQLNSDGSGAFVFTPSAPGDYELYLGTPNLPLHIDGSRSEVPLGCTRYLPASECGVFRRGERFTLPTTDKYTFTIDPTPSARYLRVMIHRSSGSDVKLGPGVPNKAGTTPYYVSAADLDGDGVLDLIVSSPDDAAGDNTVDILHGTGTGSFTEISEIPTSAPAEVVAADFDHDGIVDIVALAYDGQGPLPASYLHGTGNLTYTRTTWGDGRDFLPHLDLADFDEDGTPELVAAYADSENPDGPAGFVIVSAPSFTTQQDELAFGHDTAQAIAGDFDHDGHQDVVVAGGVADAIRLYRGDGSGHVAFASAIRNMLPAPPARLEVTRFLWQKKKPTCLQLMDAKCA